MSTKEWRDENADKMKAYRKKWYENNKERAIKRTMSRRHELKSWWHELKLELKCSKCEEDHLYCLEFHHEDPKEKDSSVSNAVQRGWGKDRILKEIAKCVVLCANCHRKLHFPLGVL